MGSVPVVGGPPSRYTFVPPLRATHSSPRSAYDAHDGSNTPCTEVTREGSANEESMSDTSTVATGHLMHVEAAFHGSHTPPTHTQSNVGAPSPRSP